MIYTKTAKKLAAKICDVQKKIFNVEDPMMKRFAETGHYEPKAWLEYLFTIYELVDHVKDEQMQDDLEKLKKYFLYVALR